jgi:TonB-dependent receptor
VSRRLQLSFLAGTALSALWAGAASAQNASAPASGTQPPATAVNGTQPAASTVQTPDQQTQAVPAGESIVITGYRGSLQSSTNAKKRSVGFVDTIFAEDIGKFPDTNIAESFNRIPGITITREITGEGVQVSIRGLGPNFTRVTLNNAPIMVASTGRDGDQGANRQVDLDLFPTELFTKLTVTKSPTSAMLEGGAAGNVDMRSARPFDNPGAHLTYSAQTTKESHANKWGYRGSVLASDTFGKFGILVGAAGARNQVWTKGFETIGWTNPNLSTPNSIAGKTNGVQNVPTPAQIAAAQCMANDATCNSTGGGNWTIPGTVPSNASIPGVAAGTAINQAFLLAQNPGATIQQIDNGIIPRLGRPVYEEGSKDRINAIASLEYKGDRLHAYLDGMYARKVNDMQRVDMDWVGRNGAAIPVNTTYDKSDCSQGCTVTGGTYYNSQWFLEFRPWKEHLKYWGINPGLEYEFSPILKFDLNANYTRSTFHRETPSVLVITPANSGVTVNYSNTGAIPTMTTNVDLDNPANFGWSGGRVNIQDERRTSYTKGARGSFTWGDQHLNLHVGSAYDIVYRRIRGYDASQQWQNAICGDQPSVFLPSPNSQPPCQGLNVVGAAPAGYPTYPAYGTGYTAGQTGPITYLGSSIPQTQLASYLKPGPGGFITVDWNSLMAASNYNQFHAAETDTGGTNTGASDGLLREKTWGSFAEVNGDWVIGDNELLFNAGVRWVKTWQTIGGRVSIADARNALMPTGACPGTGKVNDGACYPNIVNFISQDRTYTDFLPSASGAYHIGSHAVVRAAVSRTMTRPDPSQMLPGLNFSSPSADVGSVGNPDLKPYISDNIDLGFEYYTGKEGYVGFAAFRKSVSGFTINGSATVPFSNLAFYGVTYNTLSPTQQAAIDSRSGPGSANVVLTEQVNAPGRLTINGVELTWVQPLDFLLGRFGLNGFGFNANMTLVDQSGSGSAQAVATGVPPRAYNVTGYYENHGISLRVSRTWNKGFIASGFNQNGIPLAAIYSDSYGQWDFAGYLDFAKITGNERLPQLTLDVQNITKAKQRSYFQFPNATFSLFDPGRLLMVGVRGHF